MVNSLQSFRSTSTKQTFSKDGRNTVKFQVDSRNFESNSVGAMNNNLKIISTLCNRKISGGFSKSNIGEQSWPVFHSDIYCWCVWTQVYESYQRVSWCWKCSVILKDLCIQFRNNILCNYFFFFLFLKIFELEKKKNLPAVYPAKLPPFKVTFKFNTVVVVPATLTCKLMSLPDGASLIKKK